jgi:hypothetical protein
MLPSSSGQDAALSRLKPGFDSPWERQTTTNPRFPVEFMAEFDRRRLTDYLWNRSPTDAASSRTMHVAGLLRRGGYAPLTTPARS